MTQGNQPLDLSNAKDVTGSDDACFLFGECAKVLDVNGALMLAPVDPKMPDLEDESKS